MQEARPGALSLALTLALLAPAATQCQGGERAAIAGGPPPPDRELATCVVTRVADGDTIECRGVGRIRLLGIDTPEMSQRPFGQSAARALAEVAPPGTVLRVELDVERRDRYRRTLAYLWRDSVMVNWFLVRQGWAVTLTYPPNVRYVEWFTRAQREARQDGVGLWASGGFSCLPVEHRRRACD